MLRGRHEAASISSPSDCARSRGAERGATAAVAFVSARTRDYVAAVMRLPVDELALSRAARCALA